MTGNEDHQISLNEAIKLTTKYRETPFSAIASTLIKVRSEAFGQDDVQSVLDQVGAVGIRIYYGLELLPYPKFRLIIVGVNSQDEDLTDGMILENGNLCPPICPTNSPLDS